MTASGNLAEHKMSPHGPVTVTDTMTLAALENIPEQETFFISVSSELSNEFKAPRKK